MVSKLPLCIRDEQPPDLTAVYDINCSAFPEPAEADLVNRLRTTASPFISLVATHEDTILGHIFFSPVHLEGNNDLQIMGLAPMAVHSDHRNSGIGSALVEAGLLRCRDSGFGACVVLGHANFYPRFGFSPSVNFSIRSSYDVAEEVFMAIELTTDYLQPHGGTVHYHPAFNEL